MRARFDAVLFDMDGLLIDSEPLWKRAERECFAEVGIQVTDEQALVTAALTTAEVTAHWFRLHPWQGRSQKDLEDVVVARVKALIGHHSTALPGVHLLLARCRALGWKVALASNSPLHLCEHVVDILGIRGEFQALFSAEQVPRGKPAPDIYLHAARTLGVSAARCLVFEDSLTGVRAARAAGMTVFAVPSAGQLFPAEHHPHRILTSLLEAHDLLS